MFELEFSEHSFTPSPLWKHEKYIWYLKSMAKIFTLNVTLLQPFSALSTAFPKNSIQKWPIADFLGAVL